MATAAALNLIDRSPSTLSALNDLLDRALYSLASQEGCWDAMSGLVSRIGQLWTATTPEAWPDIVSECKQHPLYTLLDQDPFTHRARTKPRGYAGDAVMIDYIYRGLSNDERMKITALGEAVFSYTAGLSGSARSVRARRDLLAARIDATAERVKKPRILSVACGHLREAALSRAFVNGQVGTLCAFDQDVESLAVVRAEYGHLAGVEIISGSVRDLLKGNLTVRGFDLIYAAGLFDYLPQPVARSLVAVLGGALNSGGELLIGNFLPAPTSVGYMEAFMDWSLVWRSKDEFASLVDAIPQAEVSSSRSYIDADEAITYLEVTRR